MQITFSKAQADAAIEQLGAQGTRPARHLAQRISVAWGKALDRKYVTMRLTEAEYVLLGKPENGTTPRWRAVYRHPEDPRLEVIERTQTKPRIKNRVFRCAGGRHTLQLVELEPID